MSYLTLKQLPLQGSCVLMRVDFNVPIENGQITDDSRIRAALPSIQYILDQNASLILMSHLGKPKGTKDPQYSLKPCAQRLSELLKKNVQMAPDCIGKEVEELAAHLHPKEILLLENLRFHLGEEEPEKDPVFASSLAKLASFYVNDAFGTAHRAHASTAIIARFFPHSHTAIGFLMEKEIKELSFLLDHPSLPFYAIMGGAKISSKIGVIEKLLKRVNSIFLGGAMIYPFLKAKGIPIGASLLEPCAQIEHLPKEAIHLPLDLVIADQFSNGAQIKIVDLEEGIPEGWQGMDIGPKTIREWSKNLSQGATIFWNGPLGVVEMPNFAKGTQAIAQTLAESKGKTVIGGGDSVAAIQHLGLANRFSHLSTGGGASLEFLEFGTLPGIEALQ